MTIRRALSGLVLVAASLVATTVFIAMPAGARGGVPPCEKPVTQAAGSEVQIDVSCFMPTVLDVPVGRTVRFVNTSVIPHTVTGVGGSFGNTTLLNQGSSLDARFDKVGVFPYYCFLHPGMSGSVVVSADATRTAAVAAPPTTARAQPEPQASPAHAVASPRAEIEGQALSAGPANSPPLAGRSDTTIVVLLVAQLGLTILLGFTMLWSRLDRA